MKNTLLSDLNFPLILVIPNKDQGLTLKDNSLHCTEYKLQTSYLYGVPSLNLIKGITGFPLLTTDNLVVYMKYMLSRISNLKISCPHHQEQVENRCPNWDFRPHKSLKIFKNIYF